MAAISAAHPNVLLTHEYCDEFVVDAGRERYLNGCELERPAVDAASMEWIEWEDDRDSDSDEPAYTSRR